MIEGDLSSGHDVVLPQLLVDTAEISLFEECAVDAGAEFIERLLMDDAQPSVARFHGRGNNEPRLVSSLPR